MDIYKKLEEISDKEYALFQAKLTPGINEDLFIGVRVPVLRNFAKEYFKDEESIEFLHSLPHKYYDENMLHGLLIEQIKDYELCIKELDAFLPYVDNWAVCDIMSPKCLKKNKEATLVKIKEWIKSNKTYTIRFAIELLLSNYLDDDFKSEYLEMVSKVKSKEYYVNMMIAWYFASALAKKWDETIVYIESHKLNDWTHNKTIQKALESYRITNEQKEYLRLLKIK